MASTDDESEPQLKYELLGGDVRDILSKERITCISLSEKIVALGTEQGQVHVLDYSGNQVRLLNLHKSRVNDLSFDKEAEHIASASSDCSVVVTNLYTDQVTRHDFKWPVKVVAVDPRLAASSRRAWRDLVTGTTSGEVTLHSQGWLARADQPLAAATARDAAAGGVLALKWSGALVAWAFDSVVSVYDTTTHQLIRTLRRYDPRSEAAVVAAPGASAGPQLAGTAAAGPAATAAPAATPTTEISGPAPAGAAPTAGGGIGGLKRCSLLFAPDSHLYVAWSDIILVAKIGSYENNMGWQAPQVELVARMRLGEAVLGVSPYGDDDLAVLVYPGGAQPAPLERQQQPQPSPERKQGPGGGCGIAPPAGSGAEAEAKAAAAESAAAADGTNGGGDAAAAPPPEPPPDPLAPGRTPQLVILSRSDHREWARDSVPLPAADRCGPADYLGLLPSLPHHLHLPTATSVAAAAATTSAARPRGPPAPPVAAAAGPTAAAGPARAAVASAGTGSETPRTSRDITPRGSGGGAAPLSTGSAPPAAARAAVAPAGSGAPAAGPRRLVPVWVDGQELMFFIAAPMAIATARSRDASERVGWLLARRRWEEALSVVEDATPGGLAPGTYDRVVDGYIEELLTRQSYDKAVELSERLLKGDAKRWERLVYLFAQVRQLPKLAARVPTDNPRLRTQVYDMALQSLLTSPVDHPALLALAQRWAPGCYSLAALADAVAARLRRIQHQTQHPPPPPPPAAGRQSQPQQKGQAGVAAAGPDAGGDCLWQLLAWLYEQQGRPDLALSIHLRLRSPSVFAFVTHHGLQSNLLGRAPDLLEVDERAALALLTAHAETLPPSNVVPSIQEAMRSPPSPSSSGPEVWRRRLFKYLQGLFAVDSSVGADYHDLQVSLTAENQPAKLMDLLVSSQYYSLEAALAICEARGLVSEQVFVLGRMGNADQALRLIIDRLGDIPRAIDFVVGQRDEELWGRLIDWALGSPETTGALLDCIGGYVDPLLLVRRIPRGMRVERLRDRLRAIIADYRTQTSLREGCNAILRSDCRHLLAKLYDGTRRALPYTYVHRPGTGGEAGEWYRCDVVHGGRLQVVTAAEVPWEATTQGLGLLGPGPIASPPASSPPAAAAPAAAASNPLHPDFGRNSTSQLAPAATAPLGQAARPAGGGTRVRGGSAPALNRAATAPAAASSSGREGAGLAEGLPWWALAEGGAAAGQPADLWVGFNLAAGRARLGGEEGHSTQFAGGGGGGGRRVASSGRPGQVAGALMIGPGRPSTGSGSAHGALALGSLWQHVATRV